MIKILYLCTNKKSPSFIFYKNSLKKSKKFKIKFTTSLTKSYKKFDCIFIQGNFNKIKNINILKDDARLVLVEPRLDHSNNLNINFDLVIYNGLESKIFFSRKIKHKRSIIYPTYPEYKTKKKNYLKDNLIITYHGNKVHIENSKNLIFKALNRLSDKLKSTKIKVNLIYNIRNLGLVKNLYYKKNISVNHIQHSDSNIKKILSITDIGIAPQTLRKNSIFTFNNHIDENNFDLKFKPSTNLGRHLVFGQFKIPVITEPTPSVIKYFDQVSMNYLVHDSHSWAEVLKKFLMDKKLRLDLGLSLHKLWLNNFKHDYLNKKLFKILKNIKKNSIKI